MLKRSRPLWPRVLSLLASGMLAGWLVGCAAPMEMTPFGQIDNTSTSSTVQEPLEAKYYPSGEPYRLGVEHFNRGQYGLAERYFRDAVEKSPKDSASWIGLAGSYDRLGSFDLADRAYSAAVKLEGETTRILNNLGYSYLLRGNLAAARSKFLEARAREPDNPMILNNLKLLDGSSRYIQRGPQ